MEFACRSGGNFGPLASVAYRIVALGRAMSTPARDEEHSGALALKRFLEGHKR